MVSLGKDYQIQYLLITKEVFISFHSTLIVVLRL